MFDRKAEWYVRHICLVLYMYTADHADVHELQLEVFLNINFVMAPRCLLSVSCEEEIIH